MSDFDHREIMIVKQQSMMVLGRVELAPQRLLVSSTGWALQESRRRNHFDKHLGLPFEGGVALRLRLDHCDRCVCREEKKVFQMTLAEIHTYRWAIGNLRLFDRPQRTIFSTDMEAPTVSPRLPADLVAVFSDHVDNNEALLTAFMPVLCNHINADRIFLQPRNPLTRVCKILQWRRNKDIPWPAIPGGQVLNEWFVEDHWEDEDPLWRAAMHLEPSIYVENLQKSADEGILNLDFENKHMFHTAFIHGHAHWPPISETAATDRGFYGSVQPAVFDGPRTWTKEVRELVEECLVHIAPIMKATGETAPDLKLLKR